MYWWISFAPGYEIVYGIDYVIDYDIGHINDKVKMLSLNWLLHWVCAIRYAIDIVFGFVVVNILFCLLLKYIFGRNVDLKCVMPSRKIGIICACRLLTWSGLLSYIKIESYIKFINRL
jgi:hypothetical protein